MSRDKRTPVRPEKKTVFRPKDTAAPAVQNTETLLEEAQSYLKAGKYSRAIGSVKQILTNEPDHPEALRLSATLQLKVGGLVSARAAFDALVRKAMARRDYATAQSLLREYLKVGPRCVPFLELLGEILETDGDSMGAVGQYAKAVEILVEDGDSDQAAKGAELYKRIKRLEPNGAAASRLALALESPAAQPSIVSPPTPTPEPSPTISVPSPNLKPTAASEESQVASIEARLAAKQAAQEERLAATRTAREAQARELTEQEERLAATRTAREAQARELAEQEERLAATRAERERLTREEAALEARLAAEQDDRKERLAAEQAERDARLAAERAERERLAREQAALEVRLAAEQAERENRLAAEQAEREERLAAERERQARELTAQEERLAAERVERERQARELAAQEERLAATRTAREAQARELAEHEERLAATRAERERLAREQAALEARLAAQQAERENRLAAERLAAERAERERLVQEQAELQRRLDEERAEREGLAREQAALEASLAAQPADEAEQETAPRGGFSAWLRSEEESSSTPSAAESEPVADAPRGGFSAWFRSGGEPSSTPSSTKREPFSDQSTTWDDEEKVVPAVPSAKSPTWGWDGTPEPGLSSKRTSPAFVPSAGTLRRRVAMLSRRITSRVNAFVLLCVGLVSTGVLVGVLAVVGVSFMWIGMEEQPSGAFHDLASIPPQSLGASRNNGYLVFRELGVVSARAPVQVDGQRAIEGRGQGADTRLPKGFEQVATTLSNWYGTWDPAAEFERRGRVLRGWGRSYRALLAPYSGWIGMPFEDLGFGSLEGLDEPYILALHRLYVAQGFSGGVVQGIARLQGDLETWRQAFAQAKTLRVKVLAAEAMNDDLVIVSGLLGRPGLDLTLLPTLAEMSRPLSHDELSLRWPMQNEFVLDVKMVKAYLKGQGAVAQPWYSGVLTFFPLPEQRSLNARASYYEALVEHDSRVQVESDPRRRMPELQSFANTPPERFLDYFKNPVDNVVVPEPSVNWRDMMGRILETDARFRLASLQVQIRRPPEVLDPVPRIVRAGQRYYDPFTGFTMLLNPSLGLLYSVGRDNLDNDGDPSRDLAVRIRGVDP